MPTFRTHDAIIYFVYNFIIPILTTFFTNIYHYYTLSLMYLTREVTGTGVLLKPSRPK